MSLARTVAVAFAAAAVLAACKDGSDGSPNHAPVVDAGPDRQVAVGQAVVLRASGSDADGDPLQYGWILQAPLGSQAHLVVDLGAETGFVPDRPGEYLVALVGFDGKVESEPSVAVVNVIEGLPVALEVTARAGADRVEPVRAALALDGTASVDPAGYPLAFAWEWVSRPDGSAAVLERAATARPTFTPDVEGPYTVKLTVTALSGASATDEVQITAVNPPPAAAPGGDRDAYLGDAVKLDAGASDADGEPITYAWTLASKPAGSGAVLSGADTATPELVADVAGWYLVSLQVSDPSGTASLATFTVRVYPRLARLGHRVLDAEYSAGLDRIVMVDAGPNALYVYDPATGDETTILLSLAPAAVSVSPDGRYATVSHDAYVSYVDLVAAQVVRVIPVSERLGDIVLAGNGYAYANAAGSSYPDGLRIVNVATGAVTASTSYYYGSGKMTLHPNGSWIYRIGSGDLEKLDISAGSTVTSRVGPYQSGYSPCADVWPSEDGARLFTGCGNVFRATDAVATDMTYAGKLEGMTGVASVADSAEAAEVLAIASVSPYYYGGTGDEDALVHRFEAAYLTETGTVPVSPFVTPVGSFTGHGRWVFFGADGTHRYAIVQADAASALLEDFAIMAF